MNEPTPSQTPETDEFSEKPAPNNSFEQACRAWVYFARTLERQRNEARAERDNWKAQCQRMFDVPKLIAQRDALAEALREILKADEECEAEFAKMGIPAEPEHWTTTKAKAALATLNQNDQ